MATSSYFGKKEDSRDKTVNKLTKKSTKAEKGRLIKTLSVDPEDWELVTKYAKAHGSTVSGLFRVWIRENCK